MFVDVWYCLEYIIGGNPPHIDPFFISKPNCLPFHSILFNRGKTILIRWIPSICSTRDKMQYAMWSRNLKPSLSGIQCSIQAGSIADLEWEVVLESAAKFERDEI